jgi:hypothetical protein
MAKVCEQCFNDVSDGLHKELFKYASDGEIVQFSEVTKFVLMQAKEEEADNITTPPSDWYNRSDCSNNKKLFY